MSCHYKEIFAVEPIINWLKKRNVIVTVNLMQISELSKKQLIKAEETILHAVAVDYLNGIQSDPVVSEKIFEISDLILKVTAKIEECREQLKKNKK